MTATTPRIARIEAAWRAVQHARAAEYHATITAPLVSGMLSPKAQAAITDLYQSNLDAAWAAYDRAQRS
jgi:hypothetical protein